MAEHSQAWLEAQLLRQMAQVKAPETLWAQIERRQRAQRPEAGRMETRRGETRWIVRPILAALMLLAVGDLAWQTGKASSAIRLSDSELAGIAPGASLRIDSSDPAAIRAWVKAKTNRDIDLTCGGRASISFAGARLIDFRNKVVAAISYKLDGNEGLMFVADKGVVFERARPGSAGGRLISWSGPNQSFTLTYPAAQNLDASCVRCHIEGRRQL